MFTLSSSKKITGRPVEGLAFNAEHLNITATVWFYLGLSYVIEIYYCNEVWKLYNKSFEESKRK